MMTIARKVLIRVLLGACCAQVCLAAAQAPAATGQLAATATTTTTTTTTSAPPTKDAAKTDDAAKRDGKPTPEECKEGYPLGAQVGSVERIEFKDIAPAQAAQAASGQPAPAAGNTAAAGNKNGSATKANTRQPVKQHDVAELRQGLKVKVAQLPALLKRLECPGKKRDLVLFLAGRPMPGLTAYPPTDPAHETIFFVLERTEDNYDAWTALLGRPSLRDFKINVSVGYDDSYPLPSSSTVWFRAIPEGWASFWLVLMLVFGAIVLWAGRYTAMLRDGSGRSAMFSLARVQLTFWTFLVLGSFMFIGMITGDYLNSMNEKVLALMGISAGTALGSSIIDNGTSGTDAQYVYLSTGSWWRDILSDGTDVSIHRFQMVAWTIVLGIVFLHQVYSRLSMPDLPAALLGLMGVSAGTYLGLKITVEK
jgi:hypothetical protein